MPQLPGWFWCTSRFGNHWISIYLPANEKTETQREMTHPGSHSEFIQSQNASDLCLCERKQRARYDLIKWTKGDSQPQWVSLHERFSPQIAGSGLFCLNDPGKGLRKQLEDSGRTTDLESKAWVQILTWELMVTLGRSLRLPESHLVHPSVNGVDNIMLPGSP